MNHNNGIVSGQVHETSVVDGYHSSDSEILGTKDRRRKEMLGDDVLLRFIDPTIACYIMIKTTIFTIAPQEE